jgi:hypothetical protein
MRTTSAPGRLAGVAVAAFALAATGAPAAAAKKITGKLSKPGLTVIALDSGGEAGSKRTKPNGKFKLRPPAKRVTLHLRAADGTYAGPVVIDKKGRKGRKAILGLKAGAELGKVRVRSGHAKLKRELERSDVVRKTKARARRGVPIGAGNFGRVLSAPTGAPGPGRDLDRDGIPGVLDIDDDGDLVLDANDAVPEPIPARAARGAPPPGGFVNPFSRLKVLIHETANANAPGLTDDQIESALPRLGDLLITILPGDSSELDCGGSLNPAPPPPLVGGLAYCSGGGTGTVQGVGAPPPASAPFPDCCDPDGDGFGTLVPTPGVVSTPEAPGAMTLHHGSTTAQIGTGDLLIERVTIGGVETEFPATLQYVFATVPALVSYDDGQGNSATVSYPVAGPDPGPAGPGTGENPFPVAADPSGDVSLTVTFWRPQRRPIPPEPGAWTDIGGLFYTAANTATAQFCPQAAFTEADPSLALPSGPIQRPGAGGFVDLAADQPASAANTLAYTLNVTQCLDSLGLEWNPGETRSFDFSALANNRPDEAGQGGVSFELQP